jgi:hypothetical protein
MTTATWVGRLSRALSTSGAASEMCKKTLGVFSEQDHFAIKADA